MRMNVSASVCFASLEGENRMLVWTWDRQTRAAAHQLVRTAIRPFRRVLFFDTGLHPLIR